MPITRNEVITAGEMLRPRRDHYGNTRFTLLVSRYDMDTVYVPVFCRIRIPDNIKSHDRILVKGSLISFRERIGEGQYSPVLEIDAHEITKQEETVMERVFGKAGHVPDRPFFNAYLTGTIDYISEAPRDGRSGARGLFRRLQIQVDQEKRDRLPQYVPLQYFDDGRRLPHLDSFNLMRGDTVNVWVTLSTPTRISDERGEQRFRDLNVEDLILEKRAGNEEETARAARIARRAERERERNARRLEERAAREASAAVGELDDVYPPTKEEAVVREEAAQRASGIMQSRDNESPIPEEANVRRDMDESGNGLKKSDVREETAEEGAFKGESVPAEGTFSAEGPAPAEDSGEDAPKTEDDGEDDLPGIGSDAGNSEEGRAASLFDSGDWDGEEEEDDGL